MTDRSFFMDAEQEISGESWEEMGMERYAGVEDDADRDDDDDEMEEIGVDHGRHVLAHILAQYHAQLAALWLKSFAMATQKGFGLSLQFTNMSLQNCWRNWWSMAIPIQNMLPFKSNWRYFCTHA